MNGTLFIDYETYYDDEFSLSKMTRTEYLHDERFKVHGAAVSIDGEIDQWVTAADLPHFFTQYKKAYGSMCCFNGTFDHGITALYYDSTERFLLDPCAMARAALSTRFPDWSFSLGWLSRKLFPDDPTKWKTEGVLENSKGIRDLPPHIERALGGYACQDNYVQREIFKFLLQIEHPWHTELVDLHLTTAMSVYPQLRMDTVKAAAIHAAEIRAKEEAVARLNIDRAALRSNDRFAALLMERGVEPPTKYSEAKQTHIYAFAKTDEDFKALLEHEDPEVVALVEARLGEKSGQRESRSAMFARMPEAMPVPTKFAAAHTGRAGGDEGYNFQNLERGGALRGCIKAPKGKKVLVRDLSQIELRMSAWWCGEDWLLDLLREGGDPYCMLATRIYGRPVYNTEEDFDFRYVGKQGELSCGYGAGDARILSMLKQKGVKTADEALAKSVKTSYRKSHPAIVGTWDWLQKRALPTVAGLGEAFEHKGVRFMKGRVLLPSGRSLWYPELHVNEDGDWVYKQNKRRNKGQQWKKIFGGAFLENIIQALSYDVFMFHARMAWKRGIRMAMAVHDELVNCVDEAKVETADRVLDAIQRTNPDWCPDVPLKGEGGWGDNYLEAK